MPQDSAPDVPIAGLQPGSVPAAPPPAPPVTEQGPSDQTMATALTPPLTNALQSSGTPFQDVGSLIKQLSPYFMGGVGEQKQLAGQLEKSSVETMQAQKKSDLAESHAKSEMIERYGKPIHEAYSDYMENFGNKPVPTFIPTPETATDFATLGSLIAVVGFIAGKGKGMTPAVGALDALGGMFKGWQQGRKDLYEKEKTTFQANLQALRVAQEQATARLNSALHIAKYDISKGLEDAHIAALENGDELIAAKAKEGNIKALMDIAKSQQAAMDKVAELAIKFEEKQVQQQVALGTPETRSTVAQAIAHYQQAPLSAFAQKTPWGQAVMAEVYQVNPEYNAVDYNKINRAITAFSVGKQGDTVRSLNVASYHLATYERLARALQNGDIPAFNAIAQSFARQTGLPAPTNLDTAKQIISSEVLKAVGGSIGGVTDREELRSNLKSANSPEQLLGVGATLRELLAGQFRGLERQYRNATKGRGTGDGLSLLDSDLIDPAVAEMYKGLIGGGSSEGKYTVGQVIETGGKKYRVIGGDLSHDPDVEEVK